MGCAIAAELAGLVSEFGLVVLVLRAVRTVTPRQIGRPNKRRKTASEMASTLGVGPEWVGL
jgi:hypothetical protein